jgi:hypothetical protein
MTVKIGRGRGSDAQAPKEAEPLEAPDANYQVGRGRPPKHSQFRKGGPGGPGRGKATKNRKTLFEEELNATLTVSVEGKPRRMSKHQLAYRNLANLCAKGDLKAIALAEQLLDKFSSGEREVQQVEEPLSVAELAILERRTRRE